MYKSATKFSLRRVRILLSWDPNSADNCIKSSWSSRSLTRLKIDPLCRGWNTAAEPENLNVQDRGNLILDPSHMHRFPFHCSHIHCHFFKLSQDGPPLLITILIISIPTQVEQRCMPTCMSWLPRGPQQETFLVLANKYEIFSQYQPIKISVRPCL